MKSKLFDKIILMKAYNFKNIHKKKEKTIINNNF